MTAARRRLRQGERVLYRRSGAYGRCCIRPAGVRLAQRARRWLSAGWTLEVSRGCRRPRSARPRPRSSRSGDGRERLGEPLDDRSDRRRGRVFVGDVLDLSVDRSEDRGRLCDLGPSRTRWVRANSSSLLLHSSGSQASSCAYSSSVPSACSVTWPGSRHSNHRSTNRASVPFGGYAPRSATIARVSASANASSSAVSTAPVTSMSSPRSMSAGGDGGLGSDRVFQHRGHASADGRWVP